MQQSFSVVTLNCAGAKTASYLPEERASRSLEIARYLLETGATTSPYVVALQEELGAQGLEGDVARSLRTACDTVIQDYFAMALSPNRYPLAVKWGRRFEGLPAENVAEGMGTLFLGGDGHVTAPSFDGPDGATPNVQGRVIDLPILEFSTTPGNGWTRGQPPGEGVSADTDDIYYRPSYYQGNRDTEPRIATTHLIHLEGQDDRPDAGRFVLINLHLATLRQESTSHQAEPPSAGAPKRTPTLEARFLRAYQMSVIAHFAERVYEELSLPIVVAGDFNATPDSPEMRQFMSRLGMVSLLDPHKCSRCGTEFNHSVVVTGSDDDGSECSGSHCQNDACGAPMYTHRGNCQLVDNVLITSEKMAARLALLWVIRPRERAPISIDFEAKFSDHFPVRAHLNLVRSTTS